MQLLEMVRQQQQTAAGADDANSTNNTNTNNNINIVAFNEELYRRAVARERELMDKLRVLQSEVSVPLQVDYNVNFWFHDANNMRHGRESL